MVMFHHITYADAQSRGAIQAEILTELSDGIDDVNELDKAKADDLVKQNLSLLNENNL